MHMYHFFLHLLDIDLCLVLFYFSLSLSLSLSLSQLVCSMAHKKSKSTPSWSPLCFRASTSDSTPSHIRFRDEKARKDFLENFSWRGIHLECQVILSNFFDIDLPTVIYSRGWESSVPHFITHVRSTYIVATSDLIFEVLHVPRVGFADYPGCDRFRTMSKDKLSSLFCQTTSLWGDHQNTLCSGFTKGLRFLNMVMTFVLYPLSHCNFIAEPRAQFLQSLLEGLTIDFASHFILSLTDVCKDTATRDKLIFPSTITWILRHASVSYLKSPHFSIMCAIDTATVQWSEAQLRLKWPRTETATPLASSTPSTLASPSTGGVTLEAITAQLVHMDACLTFLVMSCVRWTSVLVILLDDRLSWVVL